MRNVIDGLQWMFAAIGGALGCILGGWDGFLYALVLFVVIDYLTGVFVAIMQRKLSSAVGFKGIAKKVAIFCLVAVAHIIDMHVIQSGSAIRTAVIFFYISNEGISIIENSAKLGLPIPKKLELVLKQLQEEEEGDDEK